MRHILNELGDLVVVDPVARRRVGLGRGDLADHLLTWSSLNGCCAAAPAAAPGPGRGRRRITGTQPVDDLLDERGCGHEEQCRGRRSTAPAPAAQFVAGSPRVHRITWPDAVAVDAETGRGAGGAGRARRPRRCDVVGQRGAAGRSDRVHGRRRGRADTAGGLRHGVPGAGDVRRRRILSIVKDNTTGAVPARYELSRVDPIAVAAFVSAVQERGIVNSAEDFGMPGVTDMDATTVLVHGEAPRRRWGSTPSTSRSTRGSPSSSSGRGRRCGRSSTRPTTSPRSAPGRRTPRTGSRSSMWARSRRASRRAPLARAAAGRLPQARPAGPGAGLRLPHRRTGDHGVQGGADQPRRPVAGGRGSPGAGRQPDAGGRLLPVTARRP